MSEINREAEERVTESEATRTAIGRPVSRSGKEEPRAGMQRTATAIRTIVPLVQRLLPLLDGNVASAVANLLVPRSLGGPATDLGPLERALMRMRGDLAVMQDKSVQQETALKRIDDRLETVKDALERASQEQKEAAEELGRTRKSVRVFALIGVVLLVISIGLNAALFLYVKGVLR